MLNMSIRFGNGTPPTARDVATAKADNLPLDKRLRELRREDINQGGGYVGSYAKHRETDVDTWANSQAREDYIDAKTEKYNKKAASKPNFLTKKLAEILKKAGESKK